jgi:hypothetical protein
MEGEINYRYRYRYVPQFRRCNGLFKNKCCERNTLKTYFTYIITAICTAAHYERRRGSIPP